MTGRAWYDTATVASAEALGVEWRQDAGCKDKATLIFFPHRGAPEDAYDGAKRICAECPVEAACLEYALAARIDHGAWGGTTPTERRRILRRRKRAS